MWNGTGYQRVEKIKEIVKFLNSDKILPQLYYKYRKGVAEEKIDKIDIYDKKVIRVSKVLDTGDIEDLELFNMTTGKDVKQMLEKITVGDVRLIDYVNKNDDFATSVLKKVFGGDTPLNEQVEKKLKPIIEQMIRGRDG